MTPGQIAYEAYCEKTGWKSLATGADLPKWDKLNVNIQEAWESAATAVRQSLVGKAVMARYDGAVLTGNVVEVEPQLSVSLFRH